MNWSNQVPIYCDLGPRRDRLERHNCLGNCQITVSNQLNQIANDGYDDDDDVDVDVDVTTAAAAIDDDDDDDDDVISQVLIS